MATSLSSNDSASVGQVNSHVATTVTARDRDAPMNGLLWIDPASGRLHRAEMAVRIISARDAAGRHFVARVTVTFGSATGMPVWVPLTMTEDCQAVGGSGGYSSRRARRLTARTAVSASKRGINSHRSESDALASRTGGVPHTRASARLWIAIATSRADSKAPCIHELMFVM